ncbi:hypothetical protein INR49_001623 [Caranx melampygus]|nr:hypothetical protein INR49_001623 [Caranx melampygus]
MKLLIQPVLILSAVLISTTGEDWKDKLSWNGASLVISNIDNKNFGAYHCQTSEKDHGSIVATIKVLKLDVSMKPSSPLLPQELLFLSCSVDTQGEKKPVIHWLSPKKEQVKHNTGAVNMMVNSQDSGEWTCVVNNSGKVKEAKVHVTVLDFSLPPVHRQFTSESMPLTIPCSFPQYVSWEHLKARGAQEIYWEFMPKLSSNSLFGDKQKLYFLSMENIQAWNHTGQSRELKPVQDLKVIASPQTVLVSGQPLNLTCSSGNLQPPDPELHLQWVLPQRSSLSFPGSDHHPADLIIPEVGTGDGGKWVCVLWRGEKKLTSAEITLKIEPKLSVWMLVIICSAAASVLLILILVFIFCRRRQRRVRHLRHRLCQCKNPKPKGFYRT